MLCIMYKNGGQVRRSRELRTLQIKMKRKDGRKGCRNTGQTRRDNILYIIVIIITLEECDLILFATKMKDYCTTIKGWTPMHGTIYIRIHTVNRG